MEFVTFHVSLNSGDTAHPNQTLKEAEYLEMIAMMFASARLFHRVMNPVVLSDNESIIKKFMPDVDVICSNVNHGDLMLERAKAQMRYVLDNSFENPVIFLDSDILINSSLSPIFEHDFDVAVTWRKSADMPINGGLLILNNLRPAKIRAFYKRFISIYEESFSNDAEWYGDQLALRDCIGLSHLQMSPYDIKEIDGCRVMFLPCDKYNFSPDNDYSSISTNMNEKVVLHFKGERKRLMLRYWNAWLYPRETLWPWVKLKGFFERQKLKKLAEAEKRLCAAQSDRDSPEI